MRYKVFSRSDPKPVPSTFISTEKERADAWKKVHERSTWPVLVFPVCCGILAFVILLTNPDIRSEFVATFVATFSRVLENIVLRRVIVMVMALYVVIWPFKCAFRQQRRCYESRGVYLCRNYPRKCFDCKFIAVVNKMFDAVYKVIGAMKHVALYVKRKLQERFKREHESAQDR